ncbi:MAG TPA: histidine kinase [Pyrinomonadaceae bacterium]
MLVSEATFLKGQLKRWLALLLLWTLCGVLLEASGYLPAFILGRAPALPWWKYFQWGVTQLYIWWALTPLVALLVRRFPLERERPARSLAAYVTAGAVIIPAWTAAFTLLYWALDGPGAPESFAKLPSMWWVELLRRLPILLLTYLVILLNLVALDYYRKYRDREYRLMQAQLQALKAQLQPHFLFNTLNSISALMHEDVEAADRMVVSLGDLLRATLSEVGGQEITLRRELEVLDLYLRIQLIRFQDRLKVNTDVDPAALDACVPNLVLQPLVENAIKHGIAPHSVDGRIDIGARREGSSLILTVRDDGPGLSNEQDETTEGVGLSNTRARLERLYGAAQSLRYGNAARGGFEVELRIPLRRAPEELCDGKDSGVDS